MKKIKIAILFVILAIQGFAQSETSMTFLGVPITGSLSSFESKILAKGFKKEADFITGSFAEKRCLLVIDATTTSKIVYRVTVVFLDEFNSWSRIKRNYLDFKINLIHKYGSEYTSKEEFYDPYYEGDGYEFQAFSKEKATYKTLWELNNGKIALAILSRTILISYQDEKGFKLSLKEEKDKIIGDL